MKRILWFLIAAALVPAASAQENPLTKTAVGDWAKYLVTTNNETIPMMSTRDQPRFRAASIITDDAVRIDDYLVFNNQRSAGLGSVYNFKDRYEPVSGILKTTKVQVVSTSKEKLTIGGKQYECTKIVRKIDQPIDESTMQSSWIGTSTLWICDKIPLGLAKMENKYHSRLTKDDEGQKMTETWVVAEFGFKNWKEE